jgi:hypothetical protein
VQGDLARYGLDEAELARRKAFVGGVRQQIQSLRAQGTMQGHMEDCDCWKLASMRLDQGILRAKHALTRVSFRSGTGSEWAQHCGKHAREPAREYKNTA